MPIAQAQKQGKVPPSQIAPSKDELIHTDQDLVKKLTQMEKAFQSLQNQLKGIHGLHDKTSKLRTIAIDEKFSKLETVISTQKQQKDQLYAQNKQLKKENKEMASKLRELEKQLEFLAKKASNPDVAAWMRGKALELADLFKGSSLGFYSKETVGPIAAGIVSYGVILLPCSLIAVYLLKNIKSMNLFRVLTALNLFDVGFTLGTILSIAVVWGDPIQAMHSISEANFIFLQLVLAVGFWLSIFVMLVQIYRVDRTSVRRVLSLEFVLRFLVAFDYGRRVWVPAVERAGSTIQLPGLLYFAYLAAAIVVINLTSKAQRIVEGLEDEECLPTVNDLREFGNSCGLDKKIIGKVLAVQHDD